MPAPHLLKGHFVLGIAGFGTQQGGVVFKISVSGYSLNEHLLPASSRVDVMGSFENACRSGEVCGVESNSKPCQWIRIVQ